MKVRGWFSSWFSIRLILVYICVCIGFILKAGAEPVEPAKARIAAEKCLAEQIQYPSWKGATLGQPITYYDLEGKPSAYVFPVLKNGQYCGYITTAADSEYLPVFEYSTAPLWHLKVSEARKRMVKRFGRAPVKETLIFLGTLDYYVAFSNGERSTPVLVGLHSGLEQNYENALQLHKRFQSLKSKLRTRAKPIWDKLSYPNRQNKQPVAKTISGVEAYTWYRGCGPTSLAMVLNYFGLRGYPNLRHEVGIFEWVGPLIQPPTGEPFFLELYPYAPRELIDEICTAINDSRNGINQIPRNRGSVKQYGVVSSELANAAETVAREHGYLFDADDIIIDYEAYRREIDANRPTVIVFFY